MTESHDSNDYFRPIAPGMGQAVAERTILRRKESGEFENWGDVADRVALGNASLVPAGATRTKEAEYALLRKHLRKGNTLLSGRHLQHGDENQPSRNMEVYTNCATSSTSFLLFYLLLNGSGVGRCYDDDMMLVDWDYAPTLRCVLDSSHPDFDYATHESRRDAEHKYGTGKDVMWHEVADSREGWAKALEIWENAAFEKIHAHKMLILDFSKVRPKGSPIAGMQNRPASGPVPLMGAFQRAATLKGSGIARWRQAMYVDHYFAECVLVGGARRAARMSTKHWSDPSVVDFVTVKRPIEYTGMSGEDIIALRAATSFPPGAFLWSSNNSVTVDEEFWSLVRGTEDTPRARHAKHVFDLVCEASYADGTGEPGFINSHRLVQNDEGWNDLNRGDFAGSEKFQVNDDTQILLSKLAKRAKKKQFHMITNPCVTGDTMVMTANGPQQVKDLIGIPFTAIVDGKDYAATGFWSTGVKPVFAVQTKRGYGIRATGNHEVLVEVSRRQKLGGGYNVDYVWRRVDDLKPGDRMVLSNNRSMSFKKDDELFNHGWLLGMMKGDGGYNPEYGGGSYVRFWDLGNEAPMIEDAVTAVEQLGATKQFRGEHYSKTHGTYMVGSVVMEDIANGHLGVREKAILPELEKAPAPFVAGFIRGFFDADGSVQGDVEKGRSVRLAQSSEGDLQAVQRMFARFGIASSICKRRDAGRRLMPDGRGSSAFYDHKAQFELVVSRDNMLVFEEKIGFSNPNKAEKLSNVCSDVDRGPYREMFVTEVTEIREDGEEEVFDCTVSEVHRFDANGLIVHNCGEITLNVLGGFCVIADVVPYHADTLDEAEECFRVTTRALMRVNLMNSIYEKEVKRTNRIGVGMTGVHEFAWKFFNLGFRDLIDEQKSKAFWLTMARFNRAVREEAISYAKELGVKIPHTVTTIKPAGTTSKLFLLTEGWHLPTMREFLRWVQFRSDDKLVEVYRDAGYPTRDLVSYSGTTIVGFPTAPTITTLGMGDKLVTAAEATPEEQFKWLMFGEKYWINGTDKHGNPVTDHYGNQISYTLKYKPEIVSFDEFRDMMLKYQSQVRCCSVMPQSDVSSYEYQPEQGVTHQQYAAIMAKINLSESVSEDIGKEHVDCASGGCPVDFNTDEKENA